MSADVRAMLLPGTAGFAVTLVVLLIAVDQDMRTLAALRDGAVVVWQFVCALPGAASMAP